MGLALDPRDDEFSHVPGSRWTSVSPADPRWFERYWLNVQDSAGRGVLGQGIGIYPNRNTMDAFVLHVSEDGQRNIRASVSGLPKGRTLQVGPLRAEILVPLRKWRFTCDASDLDVSYDLVFESEFTPNLHLLPHGDPNVVESLPIRWQTFAQAGKVTGELRNGCVTGRFGGWAGRDRSWGVRPGIGGPGEMEWLEVFQKLQWGFLLYWVLFTTPHRQVWYFGTHDPGGGNRHFTGCISEPNGRTTPIVDVEHEVSLDPESARFQKAKLRIHTSSEVEDFIVTPFSTVYLRGGLYDGLNGFYHGTARGPSVVEGESWNFDLDPQLRQSVTGLNDHASLFEGKDGAGRGVFELHYGT